MVTKYFCFVTPQYKPLAEKNRENWKKYLEQDVEIIDYPDSGDWETNCLQRPQLLYKQATYSSQTGLIDSDVVFLKRPEILLSPRAGYDLYIRKTGDPCLSRYFNAGLLLIAPTPVGLGFLRRWADAAKLNNFNRDIGLREQYALFIAWEQGHPNTCYLPHTYGYTPPRNDPESAPPADTVVVHSAASRTLKSIVNSPPAAVEPQAAEPPAKRRR